ncbi:MULTISPECIES: TIM barrel protein [unclassified Kitasatospora]|uniref:TIM barrel protein n=1 Tax=unclassified Kitasatospora TaxID=2633591 RepID=UPI00070AA936|nr:MULTISPECIES: TIM barrel protein [unclassified Kitasatospora]KQV04647.1 hydroxypyruvate isomerase [Kitasatospora sp. Root107]KRB60828.1 hydroxypyruvate isomerase [Kitasatospora sp. Root187]
MIDVTAASKLSYTVNLSILFSELPLLERPAAAAAAGFTAAELWWPFGENHTPSDAEQDALRKAFTDAGVQLTGLNFLDDLTKGARGTVSVPAESERFRENIPVAVALAESLGTRALNALYGNRVEGVSAAEQDELALENLTLAAQAAHSIGAVLLIETLNKAESPDYALVTAEAAIAVVDKVNAATGLGNAKFLCDLYHLARNGEDLAAVIATHADKIGHVQIADTPARNEPGTGELDFEDLFARLLAAGYTGRIGLEYRPANGVSADSFEWLPREYRAG